MQEKASSKVLKFRKNSTLQNKIIHLKNTVLLIILCTFASIINS